MPRLPLLLLRLLVLLVILPTNLVFASVTAGTLKGTTIDEGGLPIPGVLITITSDNMMGTKQSDTDAEGRFFFAELPPGIYKLSAEKAGFAKVSKPNLEINISRTTQVTIEMPLATGGEEIVVESTRPSLDTEQTNRSTVLNRDFLQRIPSGRSYQGAAQLAAGVTGGANPNVGGASSNENTYLLDGVTVTDPVTGTFSMNFNFDAVEQIEVLTSAFDPEYGYNLGGVISIVTDSGGNTLNFSTSAYYTNGNWSPKTDSRFAADGTELSPTDFDSQFETYQIYGKISGPIIRDKAWFLASYAQERSLISAVGIDLPRDYEGHYVFSKLTWQPSAAHKFTLLAQTDPTTIDNQNQSNRFVDPSAQYRQTQGGWLLSGQWQWFPLGNASLDSKNTVQKSFIEIYGVPCTHDRDLGYNPCDPTELENTIDFTTPGRLGVNNAYTRDNYTSLLFDDRWTYSTTNKFSLLQVDFFGTHDFKFGLEADLRAWDYVSMVTGNMYYVDLNELAYDPESLQNYYWVEYTGPRVFSQKATHWGAFAQDVYKPVNNLTIRYGVRFDRSLMFNDVGDRIIDVGLWGPRFGVSWDPWGNSKTKFVGAIGRFNDTSRLGIAAFLNRSALGAKLFLGEYFNAYTNGSGDNYSYSPADATVILHDNLTAPHSDDILVGAEREIVQDLVALLYFDSKFTTFLYEDDEVNLVWDEDGYNNLGSEDGTLQDIYRLRSPAVARRTYYRADLGLRRNFADRWQVEATYSYSVSRGTTLSQITSALDVPPQDQYYIDGLLQTDVTHDIAGGGSWDLPFDPWTPSIGATFFLESGNPETRYYSSADNVSGAILKDTVGSYAREEMTWNLNLRFAQDIPVRKGKLSAEAEIFNITNNRKGLSAYVSGDNRWIISSRQSPMRVTLGARYEF